MDGILLDFTNKTISGTLTLPGSKSISNRLLILQALYPEIGIKNLSASDDTRVLQQALRNPCRKRVDVGHAGTAMRFLTAYFASQPGREVVLTGSGRMQERPIGLLVDALRNLGAEIAYAGKKGFPPLGINGKPLSGGKLTTESGVSSQYITALLLIAPIFEKGLELTLSGFVTSRPYIDMTLELLTQLGARTDFSGDTITVRPLSEAAKKMFYVEPDWSSASYLYSLVALSPVGTEIGLAGLRKDSPQGDRAVAGLYKNFGVQTDFTTDGIAVRKTARIEMPGDALLELDLSGTPDLAQTIAVTCFGQGVGCHLTGLQTLRIKETDRLAALQAELIKLRADVKTAEDSLLLKADNQKPETRNWKSTTVKTYTDHRMAMAFAPLAIRQPIVIQNPGVVSKSYPDFWEDLKKITSPRNLS